MNKDYGSLIAMVPWLLFALMVWWEHFQADRDRERKYKKIRRENALQFECHYPDDPCSTDKPISGIECDVCVQFGCKL